MAFDDEPPARKPASRPLTRRPRAPGGADTDDEDGEDGQDRRGQAVWDRCEPEDTPSPRGSTIDEDQDLP